MKQKTVTPTVIIRPPVVTILGHVDHGKTTLLDTIRNTQITAKEHGGITQHIGAYEVALPSKLVTKNKSPISTITFIDTPGHQAFARMRVRGADVADIAVLVVAGNDGVQPQTVESIHHIKAAKIPTIVAINKIDLPDINVDKIKQQLVKLGLDLEEYGGETPVVPLSAKTGLNLDKLFEMILVLWELHAVKLDLIEPFKGVVIESTLTKNRGSVATIVVRNGSIKRGDELICDDIICKVQAMINWKGEQLLQLHAGQAAEILGWKHVPQVGSVVTFESAPVAKKPIEPPVPSAIAKQPPTQAPSPPGTIPPVAQFQPPEEKMKIILRCDMAGTLEAITAGLPQDMIEILSSGVGTISESDVLLAKTTKSIIVGFQIKPPDSVLKLASAEKVIIRTYNIIYELFDELEEVALALKEGNLVTILGEAKIIAVFPMKQELIAGVKVISGRIARGDQVKIVRENVEIGRARIKSLRHQKEDITKSEQGSDAGLILSHKLDLLTGDAIISIG
jgi:translation initiation factor IF-2